MVGAVLSLLLHLSQVAYNHLRYLRADLLPDFSSQIFISPDRDLLQLLAACFRLSAPDP